MERINSRTHLPPRDGHRALVDRYPNGVLALFDADLRYRIVGPETLPFSKREAESMVGKRIQELFPAETVAELEPKLTATLDGTAHSFDVEFDERIHHIETRPTTIDGETFGVLATQEVTEERVTARELKRQNERLDQFSSMISHDLRNPLSVALGHLDMYRESGDEADLDAVEASLERIDELFLDLTALSRNSVSQDDHEPVSLPVIATDAWGMIDTRSATLETEPCTVNGDESQLQALFENLLRNAVGHGGDDVTVRVGPLEDGFYVEDTGSGIPVEDRDRVLEHGFTTSYSGSGVGLTIVGRIADDHGFEVKLGESPEGGARFEFRESEA